MKLFLALELQGSTPRFRKFLEEAASTEADAAVLFGDLTGNAVVPIVQMSDGRRHCSLTGERVDIADDEHLAGVKNTIEAAGDYWVCQTEEENQQTGSDPVMLEMLFKGLALARLHEWVTMAEEHAREHSQRVLIAAGTGDWPFLDDVIRRSELLELCDDRVVAIDGHELVASSLGPPTEWGAPREVSEKELCARLRAVCAQVKHPDQAVLCWPHDCRAAGKVMRGFKPLLLVHRSSASPLGGSQRSGGSLSLDPGPQNSEYADTTLRAMIVGLGDHTVQHYSFVNI